MEKLRALKIGALFVFLCSVSVGLTSRMMRTARSAPLPWSKPSLTKDKISEILGQSGSSISFPKELDLNLGGASPIHTKVNYTIDLQLQKVMENLFDSYSPDYGAFVAMDAKTGSILSMVSYSRENKPLGNLALRATFPSASVFKVVTATAAIEGHKVSSQTVIPFNGRNHTLYRSQILKSNITRWTRFITLREAFGRSINSVFGKIGAFTVGPESLREYADRFGFNRKISADLPVQTGHAWIPEDAWGLAESASGYTRDNTMSPLQGALIAASVANRGIMMEPYVVQSIAQTSDGASLYSASPKIAAITMGPTTAGEIRTLMKETVLRGTSRHAFRGFFRKGKSLLDVGGKTGSLTGLDPRGKYDWFVGYADSGLRRIAFAALTIHEKKWRVKSAYLVRRAIESYFKDTLHHDKTVAKR